MKLLDLKLNNIFENFIRVGIDSNAIDVVDQIDMFCDRLEMFDPYLSNIDSVKWSLKKNYAKTRNN